MANRNFDFSRNENQLSFQITPMGAAIVEALPDRKKVAKIKRDFKQKKTCPGSALFSVKFAAAWAAKAAGGDDAKLPAES